MKLVPPYVAWHQAACLQGEPLTWLGYDGRAGEHWFEVGADPELCRCCWEAAHCPRQFAHQPAEHETLLGRLPLASRAARAVLQQVRPWIEPAQSFEKNQLGLSNVFCNSLRFTWVMGLLADAVCVVAGASAVGATPRSFAAGKLDALSIAAGTGGGNHNPAFSRTNYKPAESSMKSAFHTFTFVTPSVSVWLSQVVSQWWLLLTVLVSAYLVISGFTGFFPVKNYLKKQLGEAADDDDDKD